MIIGITGGTSSDRERLTGVMQSISWTMAYSSWRLMTPRDQQYKWRIKRFDLDLEKKVSYHTQIPVEDLQSAEIKWDIRDHWNQIANIPKSKQQTLTAIKALESEYLRSHPSRLYPYMLGAYPNWIIPDVQEGNIDEINFIYEKGGILVHLEKIEQQQQEEDSMIGVILYSTPFNCENGILPAIEMGCRFVRDCTIKYTGTIEDFNKKIRAIPFLTAVLQLRTCL